MWKYPDFHMEKQKATEKSGKTAHTPIHHDIGVSISNFATL